MTLIMPRITQSLPVELKYKLYEESVQNSEGDIDFINQEYKKIYGHLPKTLREDFCGTGLLATDWVKQGKDHFAWGIDLDKLPLEYGKNNHLLRLSAGQKKRMSYIHGNVLDSFPFSADVIVAFNFSYFIFKTRRELVNYFAMARKGLSKKGAFLIDLFGGSACYEPSEEETEYEEFSYFWDLDRFNPITNECLYHIHFKTKHDRKKHRKVYSYDWRMWSMVELREALEDAGFKKTLTYWEGEDEDGQGNGEFYPSHKEENCQSWISYIVAIP
jgi:hypothetical protein